MKKNSTSYKNRVRSSMRVIVKRSDESPLIWQLLVALTILILATLLTAVALVLTEGRSGDAIFANYWNCVFWILMSYLGNPSGVGDWELVTSGGHVVSVVAQVVSIVFYAAFTGLLVALITVWYKEIHHRAQLERTHKDLLRAFHRQYSKNLNMARGGKYYTVPSQQSLATLKLKANVNLDDVVEVAIRYYGFRVKNLADTRSIEDQGVTDRYIVEHFPVNREYGCCLNRGSNITIVSPSSDRSIGVGWFSYYLAHLGAFNYISKDYDPDPLNRTSFYNIRKPFSKEAELLYDDYRRDIAELSKGENQWLIFIMAHTKSKSDKSDIHISFSQENDENPLTDTSKKVQKIGAEIQSYPLDVQVPSTRYPLKSKDFIYVEKGALGNVNSFTMRISYDLMKKDTERLPVARDIAKIITKCLNATCPSVKQMKEDNLKGENGITYADEDWSPNSFEKR